MTTIRKRRKPARRFAVRVKKSWHSCSGGPFNNSQLLLECPGTLPFRLFGQSGRYNHEMKWVVN